MPLLTLLVFAAATPACPDMAGVWLQGRGERVLVMKQDRCRLTGTVAEPKNQILEVNGFWTGQTWTMAATRTGACATTAWGFIRPEGTDTMLIHVRGSDGLCGPGGAAGGGPIELKADLPAFQTGESRQPLSCEVR